MELGQRIRAGVKWLLVGKMGNRILAFGFGIALARLLEPADFGMVLTVGVFTGFAAMFASGGMGQSLIRAKEAGDDDFNAVFTLQLAIGATLYLAFYFASPWIAHYLDDALYSDLLRISALVFLLRPLAITRSSWLTREMEFRALSMISVVIGLITGIVSVLMALGGMGVWSLILAGLLTALLKNVLLARVTPLRLRLNFDKSIMRRHTAFGFKITMSSFLGYVTKHGFNLILSKLEGPAFLGLFNKADSQFRTPIRMLAGSVAEPMLRAMSKTQDDLDQTKYMYYRVVALLTVYLMPFFVGLWWVAEPFIGGVYGEKWLAAAEPLQILVLAGVSRLIGHPCGPLLIAQNRLNQVIVAQIAGLVVTVSACLIGLNWGLIGVAWGVVFSIAFGDVYSYILVYRLLSTRLVDLLKAIGPGLFLNALLFMVLAGTDYLLGDLRSTQELTYVGLMMLPAALFYASAFLFLPIPSLRSESARWRGMIQGSLKRLYA